MIAEYGLRLVNTNYDCNDTKCDHIMLNMIVECKL